MGRWSAADATSTANSRIDLQVSRQREALSVTLGVAVGVLLVPLAFFVSFVAAAGGDGSFMAQALLLPFLNLFPHGSTGLILSFLEFPLLGFLAGELARKEKNFWVAPSAVHISAVVVGFLTGASP